MDLAKIKATLKERVAKGLNFGIEAVEDVVLPSSHLYNEYILLKSKYNDLMYISSMNTLPYEQIEVGLNRLRKGLLGIIDDLEETHIQKQEVEKELTVQALPTRRTNFFKLLDIHFKNLESICYAEVYADKVDKKYGRQAVVEFYQMHRRRFRNDEAIKGSDGIHLLNVHFFDYFSNEIGIFEVYFKNIKHLLAYTMESEIERPFFLNTLKSLFSKFELAMIFYYAMSEVDINFKKLVLQSKLIDGSIENILIRKEQLQAILE